MQIIENTKRLMRTQIVEINQDEVKAAIAQFVKVRLGLPDRVSSEAVVRIEADECGGGARVVVTSEVEMTEQVSPVSVPVGPMSWAPGQMPGYPARPVFGHD